MQHRIESYSIWKKICKIRTFMIQYWSLCNKHAARNDSLHYFDFYPLWSHANRLSNTRDSQSVNSFHVSVLIHNAASAQKIVQVQCCVDKRPCTQTDFTTATANSQLRYYYGIHINLYLLVTCTTTEIFQVDAGLSRHFNAHRRDWTAGHKVRIVLMAGRTALAVALISRLIVLRRVRLRTTLTSCWYRSHVPPWTRSAQFMVQCRTLPRILFRWQSTFPLYIL